MPTLIPHGHAAAAAICLTIRPDRDTDGDRPCSTLCTTCKAAAAAVLHCAAVYVACTNGNLHDLADELERHRP